MYHPPSRRTQLLRRLLALFASWVAVVVGVVIVTALTLGYGFNQKDGHIERGGIIQLGSMPGAAAVTINGLPYGASTPTKLVSSPGKYAIKMEKQGYQTWQKTISLEAGMISWQTYPKLFPQDISMSNVTTFDTLADALPSGNSKNYAFLEKADTPTVKIANLESDTVKFEDVTLPSTVITQPDKTVQGGTASSYKLLLWSGDQRYILLSHTYGNSKLEWLVLDIDNPERSYNINQSFGVNPTDVVFGDYYAHRLDALIDGNVRELNVDDKTISHPLVTNVNNFRVYDEDYILYVSQPLKDKTQEVGYVKANFAQPVVVQKVPYDGSGTARIDFGKYFDDNYALISHGKQAILYDMQHFSGSQDDKITLKPLSTMPLTHSITELDITDNSQFANVQDGYSLATYNLELNQQTITSFVSTSKSPQTLQHLSNYLFWGYDGERMRTYEFDGANQYSLMQMDPRFDATFSPSGKFLYTVLHDDKAYTLQRLRMY